MKISSKKFYIIRHIPTGLIKASGHNRNFTKTGKLWLGGRIKTHLRQFIQYARRYSYYRSHSIDRDRPLTLTEAIAHIWGKIYPVDECEVIELEVIETNSQPLRQFIEQEMKEK